jgi:hypothetical protein
MPKVNLDEVISIADPLLSDNYELTFPDLPAAIVQGGADRSLRIQCKTATLPGSTIEEVLIEVFGHKVRHAGQRLVSGSMAVAYAENAQMTIYNILSQWSDACRAMETQGCLTKDEYGVDAIFRVFAQDGTTEVASYKISGCWPKTLPELSFDGTSAQALQIDTEFSYDNVVLVS